MNRIKKNNTLRSLILATGVVLLLTGCGSAKESTTDEQPKEVKIGIIRVPNDKAVAMSEGYFEQYFEDKGIETKFLFFDSGVAANQAFSSGSIDFAEMGYTNAVVALSTGIPVEMIWIHEILGSNEALVAQKDSGIKTVEDLVGKKVATPFSSTSHYSLLKATQDAGIEEDVQFLDMQTSDIVAAWERGDIDAAYTWEPTLSELKKDGTVIIDSKELADKGYMTANIDLVHKDFAEKYPELVSDYTRALDEAVRFYNEDPEAAAKAAAKQLDITVDEAAMQMQASKWLTSEEQVSAPYLGTNEKPGEFLQVFLDTALFLKEQNSIGEVPDKEAIDAFIETKYIEDTLTEQE